MQIISKSHGNLIFGAQYSLYFNSCLLVTLKFDKFIVRIMKMKI